MRDNTSTLLVEDLEQHLKTITDTVERDNMLVLIKSAKDGMYDDYVSEFECPKIELIKALRKFQNTEVFIENVANGKYD